MNQTGKVPFFFAVIHQFLLLQLTTSTNLHTLLAITGDTFFWSWLV
jgi:hypothetical protein